MFLQAPCYQAYGLIRQGVPADSNAIGQGYNLISPPAGVIVALQRSIEQFAASDRLQQYSGKADEAERELLARLVGRRLNRPELTARNVFPMNGGHEAISMAIYAMHTQASGIVLPLPGYYAFEQSALRYGMNIAGHYCERGRGAGVIGESTALVDVFANGVSGRIFELPPERGCRTMLLDMTYQVAAPSYLPATEAALAARVSHAFQHEHCLIAFTPSKDLSIPSMRAGLLVTANSVMAEVIERDRAERSYSVGPLVTRLLLYYFVMMLSYRSWVLTGSAQAEIHWITSQYVDLGVFGIPEPEDVEEVIQHWLRMTEHIAASFELLCRHAGLFLPETLQRPMMGYSCFPGLEKRFRNHDAYLNWVNRVGREARLKLNPTVMFGGTTQTWAVLYGGQYRLRVNLSCTAADLDQLLHRLADSAQHIPSSAAATEAPHDL